MSWILEVSIRKGKNPKFEIPKQVWVNFPCCLRKMAERPFWRLSLQREVSKKWTKDMAFAFSVWLIFSKNFQAQKKKYEGKQTTGLRTKHNYPSPLYFCLQQPAFIKQQDSCLHLNNIYEKSYFQIFLLYKWQTKQCLEISFDKILYKSIHNTWTLPFLFANLHYRLSFINYLFLLHSLSEPTDYSLIICEKSIGNCNTVPGSLHLKTFLVISKNANLKF